MSKPNKSLNEIAKDIKSSNNKVTLIYAFNGTGKTRLSQEFKSLITNKDTFLYYNAFTEDLFYYDNDIKNKNPTPKLKIHQNFFTNNILTEHEKDKAIIDKFKEYKKNIYPEFINNNTEIEFKIPNPDKDNTAEIQNIPIKISKAEESLFIWFTFYVFLELVIDSIQEKNNSDLTKIEYVFIDDPVSSLDENNIIQLSSELANTINNAKSQKLKFIITTHHSTFFNVLNKTLKNIDNQETKAYILKNNNANKYILKQHKDTDFMYHLHLFDLIQDAIKEDKLEKYHFNLLRNLYEKTVIFLGYNQLSDLIKDETENKDYLVRLLNTYSHNQVHHETTDLSNNYKEAIKSLINILITEYKFSFSIPTIHNKPTKITFNILINYKKESDNRKQDKIKDRIISMLKHNKKYPNQEELFVQFLDSIDITKFNNKLEDFDTSFEKHAFNSNSNTSELSKEKLNKTITKASSNTLFRLKNLEEISKSLKENQFLNTIITQEKLNKTTTIEYLAKLIEINKFKINKEGTDLTAILPHKSGSRFSKNKDYSKNKNRIIEKLNTFLNLFKEQNQNDL